MGDIVVVNVGGQRHEVSRAVLNSKPGTRLATDLEAHLREDKNDYFFDRNPQAFPPVLHYLRSGELHAPRDLCGSVFQTELEYWGINAHIMKECCWISYCSDLQNRKTLSAFHSNHGDDSTLVDDSKLKGKIWNLLNEPHSSRWARVYAVFSVLIILLSITVFCASTHAVFQEDLTFDDYIDLYGSDVVCSDYYDSYYYFSDQCYENYLDLVEDQRIERTTSYELLDEGNGTFQSEPVVASDNPKYHILNASLSYPHPALYIIDSTCVALFTLEYLLKLICSPKTMQFCINPLSIIDLLAILPYFVQLMVQYLYIKERYQQSVVDALYILQIFRMVRIFKVLRHFKGLRIFVHTVKHSWKEMVLLLAFLASGMVFFGSLIYYAEVLSGESHVKSIPHGFWWAIVTMTTVGYGDIAPKSSLGFFIGSICAVMGVLFIAFSVPTLVQHFLMFYNFVQFEPKTFRVKKNKVKSAKVSA